MKEEKKILIVEDDTDINNLLFTALKKQIYCKRIIQRLHCS